MQLADVQAVRTKKFTGMAVEGLHLADLSSSVSSGDGPARKAAFAVASDSLRSHGFICDRTFSHI